MIDDLSFSFSTDIWQYQAKGGWHFITLPLQIAEEIKFFASTNKWGSVRVAVTIGTSEWKTSLFPDSKSGTYFLPVKAEVRKRQKIDAGDDVTVALKVLC